MAFAAGVSKRKRKWQRSAEALMAAETRPEENQIIRDHAASSWADVREEYRLPVVTGDVMKRVLTGTATDEERDAVRQSLGRVQGPDGELPERDAEGRPEPGVLVGGKDEQDAQRIIAMIERREGGSAVAEELNKLYRVAKYQGEKAADQRHTEQLKRIHEANAINVVCALLAEMEEAARANGGPLPTIVTVAGYTMARVIDALHRAGYSSKGKQ
jgi:hypothetical protein